MRVDGVVPEQLTAALVAGKLSYIDLAKLQGVALEKDLTGGADGTRWQQENGWRLNDAYEILKLINFTQNKLMILQLLRRPDWMRLLWELPKEDLLRGLRFFSREKLLRLIYWLPKEFQLKILLRVLGLKYLVELMRGPDMLMMLRSEELPMRLLAKRLVHFMDKKYLHQLLGEISQGQVNHLSVREMHPMFARLKKGQVLEAMTKLPYNALQPFMVNVLKLNMQLLMHVPETFINRAFANRAMSELMAGAEVLPKGVVIKLLEQLPDDYLAAVPTLADESLLLSLLLEGHSNVILSLGASLLAA